MEADLALRDKAATAMAKQQMSRDGDETPGGKSNDGDLSLRRKGSHDGFQDGDGKKGDFDFAKSAKMRQKRKSQDE